MAAVGFSSPMLELQQEVDAAVACGRAIGLTEDESHEVIREMNAVHRELPTALSWAVVRERMIARSMGLPWRQADVETARLTTQEATR